MNAGTKTTPPCATAQGNEKTPAPMTALMMLATASSSDRPPDSSGAGSSATAADAARARTASEREDAGRRARDTAAHSAAGALHARLKACAQRRAATGRALAAQTAARRLLHPSRGASAPRSTPRQTVRVANMVLKVDLRARTASSASAPRRLRVARKCVCFADWAHSAPEGAPRSARAVASKRHSVAYACARRAQRRRIAGASLSALSQGTHARAEPRFGFAPRRTSKRLARASAARPAAHPAEPPQRGTGKRGELRRLCQLAAVRQASGAPLA